jgi:hypothetical protein
MTYSLASLGRTTTARHPCQAEADDHRTEPHVEAGRRVGSGVGQAVVVGVARRDCLGVVVGRRHVNGRDRVVGRRHDDRGDRCRRHDDRDADLQLFLGQRNCPRLRGDDGRALDQLPGGTVHQLRGEDGGGDGAGLGDGGVTALPHAVDPLGLDDRGLGSCGLAALDLLGRQVTGGLGGDDGDVLEVFHRHQLTVDPLQGVGGGGDGLGLVDLGVAALELLVVGERDDDLLLNSRRGFGGRRDRRRHDRRRVAAVTGCGAVRRVGTLAGQRLVQERRFVRVARSVEDGRQREATGSFLALELGVGVVLAARRFQGRTVADGADDADEGVVETDQLLGVRGIAGGRQHVLPGCRADRQRVTERGALRLVGRTGGDGARTGRLGVGVRPADLVSGHALLGRRRGVGGRRRDRLRGGLDGGCRRGLGGRREGSGRSGGRGCDDDGLDCGRGRGLLRRGRCCRRCLLDHLGRFGLGCFDDGRCSGCRRLDLDRFRCRRFCCRDNLRRGCCDDGSFVSGRRCCTDHQRCDDPDGCRKPEDRVFEIQRHAVPFLVGMDLILGGTVVSKPNC